MKHAQLVLLVAATAILMNPSLHGFSLLSVETQTAEGFRNGYPSDILSYPNDHFRWDRSVIRYAFSRSFEAAWPHPAIKDQIRRAFRDWEQGDAPSARAHYTRFRGNQGFFDMRSLAAHEIGHVLGLFHANDAATINHNFQRFGAGYVAEPALGTEIMHSGLARGEYRRIPSNDDRQGYGRIYGTRRLRFEEVSPDAGPQLILFAAAPAEANGLAGGKPSLAAPRNILDYRQGAAVLEGEIMFNPGVALGFKTLAQNWDFENLTSRGISAITILSEGTDGPPLNRWDNHSEGNHRFTRFESRSVGDRETQEHVWSRPEGVLFIPPTELIHVGLELDVWDARFRHANISYDGFEQRFVALLTIHEEAYTIVTGTPVESPRGDLLRMPARVRVTTTGFVIVTPNIACRVSDVRVADVTGRGLALSDLNRATLDKLEQEGKIRFVGAFGSRDLPAETEFAFAFAGQEQDLPPEVVQSGNYLILQQRDLINHELLVYARSETADAVIGNYALLGQAPVAGTIPDCVELSEIEPNDIPPANIDFRAAHLAAFSGATGTTGDVDFVSFDAPRGARIWATLDTGGTADAGATSRDSKLTLFDIDTVSMLEQDDNDGSGNGCDSTLESDQASALAGVRTTNSGAHFLSMEASQNGDTAAYRLFLTVTTAADFLGGESEPNETPDTATVIARPDAPVGVRAGSLSSDEDFDFYAIYATQPSLLHISADAAPERVDNGVDIVVELFGPAGNLLFSADSSGSGGPSDPPAEAFCYLVGCVGSGSTETNQPYFVRVRSANSSALGKYDLMVALCPIPRPELHCPGDQIVTAQGDGAILTYEPTAILGFGAAASALCNPPGGTFFKTGSHTITCAIVDQCAQTSQCTFTVTVNPPEAGPTLGVSQNGQAVIISWPASFSNFEIEATMQPEDPSSWTRWQEPIIVVDERRTTVVPQPLWGRSFFRLAKQP